MGGHPRVGAAARGGEFIPPLAPARRASVTVALAALALDVALGAVVATNATSVGLAWGGTAVSAVLLALALVVGSPSAAQTAAAVLGVLLLLRNGDRLLLAPLYGAGLLLVCELAQRSVELRGVERVCRGVVTSRLVGIVLVAGLGACCAAMAALAVTIAPARTVGFSVVGTVVAVGAFVLVLLLAQRRLRSHEQHAGEG